MLPLLQLSNNSIIYTLRTISANRQLHKFVLFYILHRRHTLKWQHTIVTLNAAMAEHQVYTVRHTTVLWLSGFCPGQSGWAGTRRNIHPLTPITVISHPLSAFSIYYDPWHPPCLIYVHDSLFPQSLSKFSLFYLLAWHPQLHTPYISSHSY